MMPGLRHLLLAFPKKASTSAVIILGPLELA